MLSPDPYDSKRWVGYPQKGLKMHKSLLYGLGNSVGNFLGRHQRFKLFEVVILFIILKAKLFAQPAHR